MARCIVKDHKLSSLVEFGYSLQNLFQVYVCVCVRARVHICVCERVCVVHVRMCMHVRACLCVYRDCARH